MVSAGTFVSGGAFPPPPSPPSDAFRFANDSPSLIVLVLGSYQTKGCYFPECSGE